MNDSESNESEKAEPLFMAIASNDDAFEEAYRTASRTLPRFVELLEAGGSGYSGAKLRFRDPDESERLGEDRFLFLWLTRVEFDAAARVFTGVFFEVPKELQKWHQVGDCLQFEGEDIFDWMVLSEGGRLRGGFTLRVARAKLPEGRRAEYDRHIGVHVYESEE